MKRICTSILLIATVAVLCLSVLASCGPTEAEYKFGFGTFDTEAGQVAAVVVIDADNKIKAVKIDEVDISNGMTDSKKAQGDSYGMLSDWGSKLAEWDDQVAYLEVYLVGKTLDEVKGVTGKETDLTAGCTIAVNSLTAAVAKAVEDAIAADAFKTADSVELTLSFSVTTEDNASYSSVVTAKATAGASTVAEDTASATFTKAA